MCIQYVTSMLTYSKHIFMPPVHKHIINIYVHLHKNAYIHIHTVNNFSGFVFLPQLCSCIGSRYCLKKKAASSGTTEAVTMREVEKHAEEDIAAEEPEPIYEEFDPEVNEIEPSPAVMPSSMASAVSSYTWKKDRGMPHSERAQRDNPYYPSPIAHI